MSDTGHCDLAAVLPYAEPVLVSPPLISVWRGHDSTFPLCSLAVKAWQGRPVLRHREFDRVPEHIPLPPEATVARFRSEGSACPGMTVMGGFRSVRFRSP